MIEIKLSFRRGLEVLGEDPTRYRGEFTLPAEPGMCQTVYLVSEPDENLTEFVRLCRRVAASQILLFAGDLPLTITAPRAAR